MKILLTSIGTRGDIEPFLAVGELLKNRGHQVVFSFPQQFANVIPEATKFHPLSPRFIELLESKQGKTVMGKAPLWSKAKALLYLHREGKKINKELIIQQFEIVQTEKPDIIIHNSKCSYPTLWGLAHQKPTLLLSPVPYFMHYVKGHAHIGFNKNLGTFLNKLTYSLSNYGLIKTISDGQKNLPNNNKFPRSAIRKLLLTQKTIFTISPSLFPRPNYWPNNVQVLGYYERNKTMKWTPEGRLENFLNKYPKIVFLTFGSMVNSNPELTSSYLYQALEELGIPTIINTASGGLIKLPEYKEKEKFLFVNNIPYEWILKKVYAVIHHGGSGTTHSALKNGCASLILPHIIDQFEWRNLVHQIKTGPKGISINQLSSEKVKELIYDLYHNDEYKKSAIDKSRRIKSEKMEKVIVDFIEKT